MERETLVEREVLEKREEKKEERRSRVESYVVYQYEALRWLRERLEPLAHGVVRAGRVFAEYCVVYGVKRITQRRLYKLIRELLEEEEYRKVRAELRRSQEGMIITNVKTKEKEESL